MMTRATSSGVPARFNGRLPTKPALASSLPAKRSSTRGKSRFTSSRSHLEEGLALYDPISHRSLGHQVGLHPSSAYLGNVLFCLDYPDQALERSSAAIAEAQRLTHPPSLAGHLATGIRLRLLVGDNAALGEWVDRLVTVTQQLAFVPVQLRRKPALPRPFDDPQ